MKLFISARQSTLDGAIDDRFGRCACFVEYDTDTGQWEAFSNPGPGQSGGAGVAAAQFVIDRHADAVISGAFGPNASGAFQAAGIKMYLFDAGISSVQQAVDLFKQGKLALFEEVH